MKKINIILSLIFFTIFIFLLYFNFNKIIYLINQNNYILIEGTYKKIVNKNKNVEIDKKRIQKMYIESYTYKVEYKINNKLYSTKIIRKSNNLINKKINLIIEKNNPKKVMTEEYIKSNNYLILIVFNFILFLLFLIKFIYKKTQFVN